MDLLTGDPIEPSPPTPSSKSLPDNEGLQHDLEKLQAAHDGLLHELAEKKTFCERLHEQLDRLVEENNDLRAQLEGNEKENERLNQEIRNRDTTIEELKENETKNQKLKQLAVKLKKELAEAKEELDKKSSAGSQEAKEQLKTLEKENERLSSMYQSSVRNFQNLQSDFDKLQDEFDSLSEVKKRCESDLKQSLNELNRTRVSAAEAKHENDRLLKKISSLEEDSEVNFNKRKELEGKIIVLQTELNEERKKASAVVGLERTVSELRSQLDIKTSEIVELGEVVERNKAIEEECMTIKQLLQELEDQMKRLKEENEEVKEQNWNLNRKLETNHNSHESDRVRVVELVEENRALRTKEERLREAQSKLQADFENRIRVLRDQLKESEDSLSFKDKEFEEYKAKVCRVLEEKQSESTQIETFTTKIEELETTVDTLTSEKESLLRQLDKCKMDLQNLTTESSKKEKSSTEAINKLRKDIESLNTSSESMKSLCRDLQCQLVSQRTQHEEKVKEMENQIKNITDSNTSLLHQVQQLENECSSLRNNNSRMTGDSTTDSSTLDAASQRREADIRSLDDTESLLSTSLTPVTKRFSCSSESESGMAAGNVLDEILNSKTEEVNKGVDQMQNLIQETEAHNLLLTEQNRVLKEEIRRLERSIQRTEVAQNLEYLKNLLVKFLTLNPGSSEKQQLVPVLKTLLKLDSNEEKLLISKAAEIDSGNGQGSTSWSFLWS